MAVDDNAVGQRDVQIEKAGAAAGRRAVDRDIMRSLPGTKAMYWMIAGAVVSYIASLIGSQFDIDALFRGGSMLCFSLLILGGLVYFHSYTTTKKLTRERRRQG